MTSFQNRLTAAPRFDAFAARLQLAKTVVRSVSANRVGTNMSPRVFNAVTRGDLAAVRGHVNGQTYVDQSAAADLISIAESFRTAAV